MERRWRHDQLAGVGAGRLADHVRIRGLGHRLRDRHPSTVQRGRELSGAQRRARHRPNWQPVLPAPDPIPPSCASPSPTPSPTTSVTTSSTATSTSSTVTTTSTVTSTSSTSSNGHLDVDDELTATDSAQWPSCVDHGRRVRCLARHDQAWRNGGVGQPRLDPTWRGRRRSHVVVGHRTPGPFGFGMEVLRLGPVSIGTRTRPMPRTPARSSCRSRHRLPRERGARRSR